MNDDVVLVCLYSGMGGVEEGARQVGMETVLSIDCWEEAIQTSLLNHPAARHECIRFDDGGKGTVENVARLIFESVRGRRYHVHGSPPCQMFSLTNPDTRRDAVEGSRQMVWFFELLQYLKNSEHPMFSWSCEQVPPARNALLRLEEQGDIPKIPAFIKKAMLHDEVLTAADFGSCQIRRRLFFGEGFTPRKRQHIEWRTVGDVLPHLRAEHDRAIADGTWDANFSQVAGEIDEEGEAWLRKGSVCLMGSIIPGKGGCSWNEDTKGRGFAYCYDFSSQTVSLMHHPPSLTYVRFLTLEETLTLAGFPSTYQFPPSVGNKDRYQMIGNAVCPAVAAGVFKGLKTTDDWWF